MAGEGFMACCAFIWLGVIMALPIALICVGALHIDECPMQPYIPIFMIVAGAFGIFLILVIFCMVGFMGKGKGGLTSCLIGLLVLIFLFMFAWNITGSVWVFKHWSNWENVKNSKTEGCYNDMYLFAFAYLIIFWITCPCLGPSAGAGAGAARS